MTTVADRLSHALAHRKINPTQLSKQAGVGQTTIQRIMDGFIKNPTEATIRKLAASLTINFVWLRTGVGDMLTTYSQSPTTAPHQVNEQDAHTTYLLHPTRKWAKRFDAKRLEEWEDALGWIDESEVTKIITEAKKEREKFERLKKILGE